MKISIEIDCSPEEARRFMGLPDLTPLQDRYVGLLQKSMEQTTIGPDAVDAIIKGWAPMGEAGTAMWRRMFETATKSGS
ncbi:DUF6489 family protein [Sphingomonas mucosissima]|uniref:Uncharacterized protein n=1 Tax=Sphingomonas mucosissima TaxID=370959 RepID=A0A245ZHG5_9SPHN|nr:DUF6489 family protein [Sphingomonas mucosissima]OWK29168.1 hypothetical protein SPMU_26950 [Sphingomonas mucosissima]